MEYNPVETTTQSREDVTNRFNDYYKDVIFDPHDDVSAQDRLLKTIDSWRNFEQPTTTVFTSGVYDLLHPNHKAYLARTKMTGAELHYERHEDGKWDNLSPEDRNKKTSLYLASGALRLIVGVDSDNSVAIRKGFNPAKGNVARPITSWQTRAMTVADVTIPLRKGNSWQPHAVANAITAHGEHDFDQNSPHHTVTTLAEFLQPDVWAIFGESEDVLSTVPYLSSLGNTALRCIPEDDAVCFTDEFVGNFSTTAITKRIKGEL